MTQQGHQLLHTWGDTLQMQFRRATPINKMTTTAATTRVGITSGGGGHRCAHVESHLSTHTQVHVPDGTITLT